MADEDWRIAVISVAVLVLLPFLTPVLAAAFKAVIWGGLGLSFINYCDRHKK